MGYKINVNGIEITTSTATEALALAREAAMAKRGPGRPPKTDDAKAQEKHASDKPEDAVKFLTAIQSAGPNGADARAVAKALNLSVKKLRGIGASCRPINKMLTDLGYDHKAVYNKERVASKGRFWKAGPQMVNAIDAIRSKMAG